jgi:NAD-dependent dihydropyrimidine dehydrogenase PreA subunit
MRNMHGWRCVQISQGDRLAVAGDKGDRLAVAGDNIVRQCTDVLGGGGDNVHTCTPPPPAEPTAPVSLAPQSSARCQSETRLPLTRVPQTRAGACTEMCPVESLDLTILMPVCIDWVWLPLPATYCNSGIQIHRKETKAPRMLATKALNKYGHSRITRTLHMATPRWMSVGDASSHIRSHESPARSTIKHTPFSAPRRQPVMALPLLKQRPNHKSHT